MRFSRQRNEVLATVLETSTHPTADWIYEQVRKKINNISLGTVYRNLNQLVSVGSLKQYHIDRIIHYDAKLENHHHFLCNSCNNVFDVSVDSGDYVNAVETDTNHIVQDFQALFTGLCKNCK